MKHRCKDIYAGPVFQIYAAKASFKTKLVILRRTFYDDSISTCGLICRNLRYSTVTKIVTMDPNLATVQFLEAASWGETHEKFAI